MSAILSVVRPAAAPLKAFDAFAIELEYLLVRRDTLDVAPVAARVIDPRDAWWSSKAAPSVVELTNPCPGGLDELNAVFRIQQRRMSYLLERQGARLMPSAMHPWRAGSRGLHVSLPFAGDDELGRLQSAVRLVLPLVPALAASSPYRDGAAAGALDERVLALASGGIEWSSVRSDRRAIEIRLVDAQECVSADLGVAALVVDLVRWVYDEEPGRVPTEELVAVLGAYALDAERAPVTAEAYLRALRLRPGDAGSLWATLGNRLRGGRYESLWRPLLERVLARGTLARRLLTAAGPRPARAALAGLYRQLCDCLDEDRPFDPARPR